MADEGRNEIDNLHILIKFYKQKHEQLTQKQITLTRSLLEIRNHFLDNSERQATREQYKGCKFKLKNQSSDGKLASTQACKLQDLNIFGILDKSQDMFLSQKLSTSQSPKNCEVVTSSFEDLSSKLNQYIEHYLNENQQPQQFLDSLSLQNSVILDEELSQNSLDRNSLRSRIYQKLVEQLGLSVILSASMEQSQTIIQSPSNFEQLQVLQMMSTSTPSTPAKTECESEKKISNSLNSDQFSFDKFQSHRIS